MPLTSSDSASPRSKGGSITSIKTKLPQISKRGRSKILLVVIRTKLLAHLWNTNKVSAKATSKLTLIAPARSAPKEEYFLPLYQLDPKAVKTLRDKINRRHSSVIEKGLV